jgi:hypothetical protein
MVEKYCYINLKKKEREMCCAEPCWFLILISQRQHPLYEKFFFSSKESFVFCCISAGQCMM